MISWCYGVILPDNGWSSLCSMVCLIMDELQMIHEYCGLALARNNQIIVVIDQKRFNKSYCRNKLLHDHTMYVNYVDKVHVDKFRYVPKVKYMCYIGLGYSLDNYLKI